jgi:hypothetical protein
MTQAKILFSVSVATPHGNPATTTVRIDLDPKVAPASHLEEIVREARRNIASRGIDYDLFTSDSAYLDALDKAMDSVTVTDVSSSEPGTAFFCRANLSDVDRRIFVRNIHAPQQAAAKILMLWELAKLHSITPAKIDDFLDFICAVELQHPTQIAAAETAQRSYIVSSPKGDDVLVTVERPVRATMFEDVAEVFMLASVADPTIDPSEYTDIRKAGPTARYYVEADYRDGDDYRTWVDATDAEEAEFHVASEVEANQTGMADESVMGDLGDFIESIEGTNVTTCHLDPVTRDELLQAVRTAIAAYDTRTGLPEAIESLREMSQSMTA